jgi:hypothetical protein
MPFPGVTARRADSPIPGFGTPGVGVSVRAGKEVAGPVVVQGGYLDNRSGCPRPGVCAECGSTGDVGVVTVDTPVGVYCVSVCGRCEDLSRFGPALGWGGTVERVLAHCEHLGIDPDEMARLRAEERQEDGCRSRW